MRVWGGGGYVSCKESTVNYHWPQWPHYALVCVKQGFECTFEHQACARGLSYAPTTLPCIPRPHKMQPASRRRWCRGGRCIEESCQCSWDLKRAAPPLIPNPPLGRKRLNKLPGQEPACRESVGFHAGPWMQKHVGSGHTKGFCVFSTRLCHPRFASFV